MENQAKEVLPNLDIRKMRFGLSLSEDLVTPNQSGLFKEELLKLVDAGDMAPLYRTVASDLGWNEDVALMVRMEESNKKKIEELSEAIKDAEENLGENEVREALLAKAEYLCRIGSKDDAITAYRIAAEKTVSLSQRLDIAFTLIRMGFFFSDNALIVKNLAKSKFMLQEGGDWDRKNRLKVYEALHLISIRDFKKASTLFLDGLTTFTAVELCSFEEFVNLACICGILALDRVTLKTKMMDSPEVRSVIKGIPHIEELMSSLYFCDYAKFFKNLAAVTETLKRNHLLAIHQAYFCREMRIRAYSQLLKSYKAVQLESMADMFGVTVEFLDMELSRFIFSGRLHCKIDRVNGIVETSRADQKSFLYAETIRKGDALLNRVQRLSRAVNI